MSFSIGRHLHVAPSVRMLQFLYSSEDLLTSIPQSDDNKKVHLSKFDRLLRSKWDEAMENGCFRYRTDNLPTKILPGPLKLVVQLNIKRAAERRPPQNIVHINQPFNPDLFNFTKVNPKEVLFELQPDRDTNDNSSMINDRPHSNHHAVIINVSPLEYCSILVVPRRYQCLPQALTEDGIHLALDCVLLSAHSGFRIGFNSLCALASVNHQHFHGYFLDHQIPIQTTLARCVIGPCYELPDWPVRSFVFQLKGSTVQETTRAVYKVASILQQKEIAHNLFITRGDDLNPDRQIPEQTIRVILWPRKSSFGTKQDLPSEESTSFNVALCELAGHIPTYDQECFGSMTEEIALESLKSKSLTLEEFEAVKDTIRTAFSN